MSITNLPTNVEDIRLSNVFRHHYVRSLSPKEKDEIDKEPKNFSLAIEPQNKSQIKSKILYEERINLFLSILCFFFKRKR